MDDIQLLISGYLDGDSTDAEVARLAALLAGDEASLERFVFHSFIHSQLMEWMSLEGVRDQTMLQELATDGAPHGQPIVTVFTGESDSARSTRSVLPASSGGWRPRLLSLSTWAAVLLFAVSISALTYIIAARPMPVGQLTEATNCRWANSESDIAVGAILERGRDLHLVEGSAVITFASGAKLLLEGPAVVRLDSASQVHLIDGRIAAKVPRQAVGFTVTSSLARFIDLGTAFTLNLVPENSFELHVFEGLVELHLDKRFGEAALKPARVAAVRAVSFDVASGDIANLHFQEGKQMPF